MNSVGIIRLSYISFPCSSYFTSLFHFKVKLCISKLEMIAKGDIIGARRLDEGGVLDTSTSPEDGETSDFQDPNTRSSLQYTESISVLKKFFKPRPTACKHCKAKNPKITKPTFGWFYMVCSVISRGYFNWT